MGGPAEWASPKQPHGKKSDLAQHARFSGSFPKSARLRSRSDFSRAKASSERVVTRHFVFLLSPQRSSSPGRTRLGVTASRKVGTSVVRNRAKRLVREAFRATSTSLWTDAVDVIVVVRHVEQDTRLQTVIAEWESARARLNACVKLLSRMATSNPTPTQPRQGDPTS